MALADQVSLAEEAILKKYPKTRVRRGNLDFKIECTSGIGSVIMSVDRVVGGIEFTWIIGSNTGSESVYLDDDSKWDEIMSMMESILDVVKKK